MDLHEQGYFIAIAETGSLTKAAERVHVSQQALSLYLSRLEKQMSAILFIRGKNKLELTEIGELYLDCCKRVQSNWYQTKTMIHEYGDNNQSLTVCIPPMSSETSVFVTERLLQKQYEDLRLTIEHAYAMDCPDLLRSGKIDFAMCAYAEKDDDLEYRDYQEKQVVLLVPCNHRLAKYSYLIPGQENIRISINEVQNDPMVIMDERTAFGIMQRKWFAERYFTPNTVQIVQHFGQMVLWLRESNEFIGVMPRMNDESIDDIIVPIALEDSFVYRSALFYLKKKERKAIEESFINQYLKVRRNKVNNTITELLIPD